MTLSNPSSFTLHSSITCSTSVPSTICNLSPWINSPDVSVIPTVNSRLPNALEAAVTAAFGQGAEDDNESDPAFATQRVGSRAPPMTVTTAAAVTAVATTSAAATAATATAGGGGAGGGLAGGGGGGGAGMSGASRCISPLSDVSCVQKQLHGIIPTNEAEQPVKSDISNRNINGMFPASSSSGSSLPQQLHGSLPQQQQQQLHGSLPQQQHGSLSQQQHGSLSQQQQHGSLSQQQQHGSLPQQQQRLGSYTVPFSDSDRIEKNILRSKSASKPVTVNSLPLSLPLPLPCSPSDIRILKKEEIVIHDNQNKDIDNVKYSCDQNAVCEEKKVEQVEAEVEAEVGGVVEGKVDDYDDDDENENVNNVNEDLTAVTRAKTPISTPSSLGQSVLDTMYSMMRSNFS